MKGDEIMQKFNTIEEFLDNIISQKCVKSFYPSAVMKQVNNITYDNIIEVTDRYIADNRLKIIFEIRCPECADSIATYEYYADIPEISKCIMCGEEDIERVDSVQILYKIIR